MGRKLDALLGRNFKTSKFKTLTRLVISRTAVLKSQRQSRHHHAMSDVELLKLGHHECSLLRVEHVIKDRNMMDVFVMIEDYCNLVSESAAFFENHKECPDELQEAVSSLIFASSRCGEFPELLGIRTIFASRFWEIVCCACCRATKQLWGEPEGRYQMVGSRWSKLEFLKFLHLLCQFIQKLSARQSSLEIRMKALTELASEAPTMATQGTKQVGHNQQPQEIPRTLPKERSFEESFSESLKLRKNYTNFAAAALDAFAARVAVELSRSESHDGDQGNGSGSSHHWVAMGRYEALEKDNLLNVRGQYCEIYPTAHISSESEGEDTAGNWSRISSKSKEMSRKKPGIQRVSSTESSDSEMNLLNEEALVTKHDRNDHAQQTVPKHEQFTRYPKAPEEDWFNSNRMNMLPSHSPKRKVVKSYDAGAGNHVYDEANYATDLGNQQALKLHTKPISVRTRRVRGN